MIQNVAGPDLPDQVEFSTFGLDIVHIHGLCPFGRDLIEAAEKIGQWKASTQVSDYGDKSYTSDNRSSHSCFVRHTAHPDWLHWEAGLLKVVRNAARIYRGHNSWVKLQQDTGYELLRYGTGQRFGVHCDQMAGRHEGARVLSLLVYLNDDYEGGELWFPRQQVTIKPQAGDVVLFPSNFCYPHEAREVRSGRKYAVVTWLISDLPKPNK